MNLNTMSQTAYKTAIKRNGGHEVADILKHCAGEVIEAQEAFILWKYDAHNPALYAEELADVIICALIAAGRDDIDIEAAVLNKMQKNAVRAELGGNND